MYLSIYSRLFWNSMRIKISAMRGRGGTSGEKDSWHIILEIGDDISNTVTSVLKDNYVLEIHDSI